MKKLLPLLSISFLTLSGVATSINKVEVKSMDAYSVANLPTTINLNDNTDEEIRNYYSSLSSLSEAERKGNNLLKNLKPILAKNQKYYSYDSNTKIWQMYEITDRDWEKSPASETEYGTYDASSNTIKNYEYGSTKSHKNNPFVHALYNNRNLDNQARAWGNHNQDAWGINQEHIWAKSHGFDTKGSNSTGGSRGDPMHLWAGNGWANHEHSNYFFAFVDKNRSYSDAGTKYQTAYGNLTGYSVNVGGNETVFEPQDSDKGDIARAIFYMAARYNYLSGSDVDTIDGNNPNLYIANNLEGNKETGTSSATKAFSMGLLSDLLAWNKLDPVDDYETHRNNLLFNNYTNNRNPFIDFPEWADYIWGTADIDGTNYNPTPLGAANPASDPIGEGKVLSLSTHKIKFSNGQTTKISAKHADDTITWTVNNPDVISLSKSTSINDEEITVTALANGSTTITATALSEGIEYTKTIEVKVTDKITKSLTLEGGTKEFKLNDTFSVGNLKVIANYVNGTSEEVTGYIVSEPDMSIEGSQDVTVTYDDISENYQISITKPGIPKYLIYIAIGVGAIVLLVVVIIFAKGNKKTRKKIISAAKKGVKSYTKSASSTKKSNGKKSSSKKK